MHRPKGQEHTAEPIISRLREAEIHAVEETAFGQVSKDLAGRRSWRAFADRRCTATHYANDTYYYHIISQTPAHRKRLEPGPSRSSLTKTVITPGGDVR